MTKPYLKIEHKGGKVEVTALKSHGGEAVSGTLVLGKPSDYDSLSETELRFALPPLGESKFDVSAKPKSKKKKKDA